MGGVKLYSFIPLWAKKRLELAIPLDAIVIISTGELNENKNNKVIIQALQEIKDSRLHYILCGEGPLKDDLQRIAGNIQDRIHFLGYRNDVKELLSTSDIFVLPSKREGLSRSLMEAMACGLPCIISRLRGNTDLVIHGDNGFLCNPCKPEEFARAIIQLVRDSSLMRKMGEANIDKIRKFDVTCVEHVIKDIYNI